MVRLLQCLLLLAAMSIASTAWAQSSNEANAETEDVEYTKNTEYDFEDDLVEGSFVRPEGEYFNAQKRGRHSSLIRIRQDFVPEMLKSAEDI
ncbi:MAG: hypothetical protein VYA30_05730 [Myxococcota bacterium]|nr:hypothetical protein [Myxococcota bacterium]